MTSFDFLDFLTKNKEIFGRILIWLISYIFLLLLLSKLLKFINKKFEKEYIKNKINNYFLILRWIIDFIFLIILVVMILSSFKVKIGSILVSLGAFAGILVFVFQKFIQNILKGFMLLFQDQLREEEWVNINNQFIGKVINISLSHITLRNENNSLIYIPNESINSLINLSRNDHKFILNIKLKRNLSLEKIERLINEFVAKYKSKGLNIEFASDFEITSDGYQFVLTFIKEYKTGLKLSNELKKELLKLFGDEIIEITKT